MCSAPIKLDNGSLTGCRNCKQCTEQMILDWSGRCIAESKTSTKCHSITLTYGRGQEGKNLGQVSHERAAVLTYSDVQKYFKRLRKAGFPCSYFCAGEYGSMKGRAHWHIIIFWHDAVPKHKLRKNFMEVHWPHGWSFWDSVGPASVRYVCKYVQKDLKDAEAQGLLRMSKKPPLGARYFADRARRYVAAGLAPQDLFYSFPEAVYPDGKKLRFILKGRSADMFLEAYLVAWWGLDHRGLKFQGPPTLPRGPHYPSSELVEEFEDKTVKNWKLSFEEVGKEIFNCQHERKMTLWRREVAETERKIAEAEKPAGRAAEYAIRMQPGFQG